MRKGISTKKIVMVLMAGFIITGCGGTPDMNPVQEAQNEYKQIKDDTLVISYAPIALKEAELAVKDAKNAMQNNDNAASINEQAYIAQQRVKIAQKKAELRAARDQIQRASSELQTLLDNVRRAEQGQMSEGQVEMTFGRRAKHLSYFRVQQTNRGLLLRFKDVTFDTEKASLKSSAEPPVNELADFLGEYPERALVIEGHTDNTGAKSFNKNLSQQRANAVREALVSRGIGASRIEAIGLGEEYPIASNETETGRRRNRRVDVIISDKSGEIPDRQ